MEKKEDKEDKYKVGRENLETKDRKEWRKRHGNKRRQRR